MDQEPPPTDYNVHKVARTKLLIGGKIQQASMTQKEEHWQWTSVKRKRTSVLHNQCSDEQQNEDGANPMHLNAPQSFPLLTHHGEEPAVAARSGNLNAANPATRLPHSETIPIEETSPGNDLTHVRKISAQSNSKYAVEIPRLELTKVKEIASQARLEAGAYVCHECQTAAATSRNGIEFHRRYPLLLFFCIFLNLLSILSFLFCISVLRTIFPNPAF